MEKNMIKFIKILIILFNKIKHFTKILDECLIKYGCSLHLNSYSTKHKFGPIYSTKNSVGLMIGTGNTGEYLS